MTCLVLRPFEGPNGKRFLTGEVVETTDWRANNAQSLIDRRYLRIQSAPNADGSQGETRTAKNKGVK